MLTQLSIRNIVLIAELELDFNEGLTVLTGETGAGKSILLDALGLALGSRADFGLIGPASDRAEVRAIFNVKQNHPVLELLNEADIDPQSEIILRRHLRDGKSPALINDTPVSSTLLRQVGDKLVEIQGQFEGRGLLDVQTHLNLLDRFAGTQDLAIETAQAYQTWTDKRSALQNAIDTLAQARADEDWLRDAIEQLDQIKPQNNEEEKLTQEHQMLTNTSKIAEILNNIEDIISAENGTANAIAAAAKTIDRNIELANTTLAPISQALGRVEVELDEAKQAIIHARDKIDTDPNRLLTVDDRLHALRTQARKHNVSVNELPELHAKLAQKLASLDDQSGDIATLTADEENAAQNYKNKAQDLSQKRQQQAKILDQKVTDELPPLKLEQATFITRVEQTEEHKWGSHGIDNVRFEASTNPNMKAEAIDKIASGGELARFLLALKVVLADISAPMSLVFDEVDSGVGGAVAAAVGERLARLGEDMQSIVITHSPQVAARGRYHFKIDKSHTEKGTISKAAPLRSDERLEEIGRMLSGAKITPEARAAALRLLETT